MGNLNGQTWPPSGMQGSGTEASPWQITTPDHLVALSNYVNLFPGLTSNPTIGKFYKLMNDIDMSGVPNFTPIGIYQTSYTYGWTFAGNFDGNGKAIKNLTITSTSSRVGLFSHVTNDATFKNLGIENCNITGGQYTGALIGTVGTYYSSITTIGNITISGCYVTGTVNGSSYTGGLVGCVYEGSTCNITDCYTECNVTGTMSVGGLVGRYSASYSYGIVSYCYTKGTIKGTFHSIGGIIGGIDNSQSTYVTVKNCVAANDTVITSGTATGYGKVVGINTGTVQNCYSLSTMICYNGNGTNPGSTSVQGTPKTLEQLQSYDFYTNSSNWNTAIWDMTSVWNICDNKSLPFFRYQIKVGSITPTATTGGSIYPNYPQTPPVGSNITFTAYPDNCKEVDVWKIENTIVQTGGNTYNYTSGQCDETLTVSFKSKTYTIIPSAGANGTISPNTTQTIDCGTSKTFTATPNATYEVDKWFVDGSVVVEQVNSFTINNITENHTIEVTFKYVPQPCIVTFNANGGNGTMTPQTFTEGVAQQLKCNEFSKTGYKFKEWNTIANGSGQSVPDCATITITSNWTLFAQWETTHVPVTNITNVPTTATANVPLTLTGTVIPSNATYKTIVWSVKSAGTTGAKITGNVFTATSSGTATITATIQNGIAVGTPFTKDFSIKVDTVTNNIADYTKSNISVYPNPTNNYFTIKSEHPISPNITIYDITGRQMNAIIEYSANEIKVDISHLSSGMYVLRVENEMVKILKE